jgi:hypothetical protein
MYDITKLVFYNISWLLFGFFFYYLLSTIKVFLLVRIQPKFYQYPPLSDLSVKNLWHLYKKAVFRDKSLHRNTAWYLRNKGGKETWKLVGNKKIDLYYNLLNTITDLLKPYLLIAIVWAVLKAVVAQHFHYNELQISLGQIQLKLTELKEYPAFKYINENKNYYFLGISIAMAILVIAKQWEERVKQLKTVISTCLVILSILFSLSFFGADIGKSLSQKASNLSDLDFEVAEMHENIYKTVAERIIYTELCKALKDDIGNNRKEVSRLDSLHKSVAAYFPNITVPIELTQQLNNQRDNYAAQIDLELPNPHQSPPGFLYTELLKAYDKKYASTYTVQQKEDTYWDDRNKWNKEAALKMVAAAQELPVQPAYFDHQTEAKIHSIAKYIADFISEKGIDLLAKGLKMDELELPKSIASFLAAENLEKGLVNQIKQVVQLIRKAKSGFNMISGQFFKATGNSAERITAVQEAHNKEFQATLKTSLEKAANEHLESLVNEEITKIISETLKIDLYSNSNQYVGTAGYDVMLAQATQTYKKQAGIGISSIENYKRLIERPFSQSMLRMILQPGTVYHPFPADACPLCAYSAAKLPVL